MAVPIVEVLVAEVEAVTLTVGPTVVVGSVVSWVTLVASEEVVTLAEADLLVGTGGRRC